MARTLALSGGRARPVGSIDGLDTAGYQTPEQTRETDENPVDAFFRASRYSRDDVMVAVSLAQLVLSAYLIKELT